MAYGTYSFNISMSNFGDIFLTSPDLGSHVPAYGFMILTGYDDNAGGAETADGRLSFGFAIDADQISTPSNQANRGMAWVASLNAGSGGSNTGAFAFGGVPASGSGSEWGRLCGAHTSAVTWHNGPIVEPYQASTSPFLSSPSDECGIGNVDPLVTISQVSGFIAAGGFGSLEGGCTQKVTGELTFNTTLTPVSVTGLGFTPDFVILFCGDYMRNGVSSLGANGTISIGIAVNDGSQTQRALSWGEQNNVTNGNPKQYLSTTEAIVIQDPASSAKLFSAELNSFDVGGFTMTPTFISVGETHTRFCGWLAVKLHGGTCALVDYTTPTATGSHATTGVGFTPQMCLAVMGSLTSTDSSVGPSNDTGGISISTFTAGSQWAGGMRAEAGVPPNTASFRSQKAMQVPVGNLINSTVAQFTSFDADGFTLNFTTTDGTARKGFVLALSAETPCSSPPPPPTPIVPGAATSYVRVWGNYP